MPEKSRTLAGRYRSAAWEDGYLSAMGGMGEPCPHPPASIDAIDWEDGHAEALKTLRYLLEA